MGGLSSAPDCVGDRVVAHKSVVHGRSRRGGAHLDSILHGRAHGRHPMDELTGGTKATIVELFDAPLPPPVSQYHILFRGCAEATRPPLVRALLAAAAATSSGPRRLERAASNRRQRPPPHPTAPRRRLPSQRPPPRPTAAGSRVNGRHRVRPRPVVSTLSRPPAPASSRRRHRSRFGGGGEEAGIGEKMR
jgi:hypothetical protein